MSKAVSYEKYQEAVDIAKKVMDKYEELSKKYGSDLERLQRKNLKLARTGQIKRGENTLKIKDLKKKGNELMEKTQVYSEKADQARNKKSWLQDLIKNDETEILADEKMTLEQMEKLEIAKLKDKYKKQVGNKKREFLETYNELRKQARPNFEPDSSELRKRQHAQNAIKERLRGVEDPNQLAEIFENEFSETQNEARLKELYSTVANRLKATDSADSLDALERVEKLRRQQLLEPSEREQLEKYEAISQAEQLVKNVADYTEHEFKRIDDRTEDVSAEDTDFQLENGPKAMLDEAVNRMKGEKDVYQPGQASK